MHKTRAKIKQLRAFIEHHRLATLLIVGAVGIAAVGNFVMAILGEPQPATTPTIFVKKKEKYYAPLTGLQVKDKKELTKPITAIMIENFDPDARPQSGLKAGETIYETIAEGGITRFMVLYQQNKPQLIGPVRSLRPYYLDWAKPYDASIVHVGGSAKALAEVRNHRWRDLDQFFNADAYWRSSDRYAPHNVYTSFAKIDTLEKAKHYTSSNPVPILRTDAKPATKPTATQISVHMSSEAYDSSYTYDKKSNSYLRSQGNQPHIDREKGRITPVVVVVMKVPMRQVMEETWRESMQTIGSGYAVVFQNGTATQVTWHKRSANTQISFTKKDGKPFGLARGQTWITAIPSAQGSVTWK